LRLLAKRSFQGVPQLIKFRLGSFLNQIFFNLRLLLEQVHAIVQLLDLLGRCFDVLKQVLLEFELVNLDLSLDLLNLIFQKTLVFLELVHFLIILLLTILLYVGV